jgi:ribosomal protein L37AE/L43A
MGNLEKSKYACPACGVTLQKAQDKGGVVLWCVAKCNNRETRFGAIDTSEEGAYKKLQARVNGT